MNSPDRLYIEKNTRKIIKRIEDKNLLNIKDATQKELFLWAMSLGYNAPLKLESRDGLFLDKNLNTSDMALIYTCYSANHPDVNDFADKSKIYSYAEECANRGFRIINEYFESGSIETLDRRLLLELNDLYDKLNI